MAGTSAGFPQIQSPIADANGKLQQAWYQLLVALWNRTGGGGSGVDVLVIEREITALSVLVADLAVLRTQEPSPAGLIALADTVEGLQLTGLQRDIFAASLMAARTIAMTGDGTWSVAFDGSADVTGAMTLATVNVSPGTYSNATITVNGKGLVTSASAGAATGSGTAVASEALAAGDLCNLYTNAGVATIRKADATDDTKPANAFVTAAVLITATASWFGPALIDTAVSGLTPGTTYFLATTPGTATATPPSSAGNLIQKVGFAKSATELVFFPSDGVTV